MIRKMRLGVLQGGVFSNMGLAKIDQSLTVLSIPFLFHSREEFNAVFDQMKPAFEKMIEEKGFKMILWTLAGWVNFFTKEPVVDPDDLKKLKISVTADFPEIEQVWKKMGYEVVPGDMNDLMIQLQSGAGRRPTCRPSCAGSGQFFALVPHMLSPSLAPLVGGLVLSDKAWASIPADLRQPFLDAVVGAAKGLYEETMSLEADAVKMMKDNGLIVHDPPAAALAKWREAAGRAVEGSSDRSFPRTMYDQIVGTSRNTERPVANRFVRSAHAVEDSLAFLSIFALAAMLLAEAFARKVFNTGIRDSGIYIEHLVLAATFIAGAITSREKRHLALATGMFLPKRLKGSAETVTAALASALTLAFGLSALSFARNAFTSADRVGFLPKRLVVLIIGIGFLAMSVRFITGLEKKGARLGAAVAAAVLGLFFGFAPLVQLLTAGGTIAMPALSAVGGFLQPLVTGLAGPMIIVLIAAAFLGLPIFTVLGGIGLSPLCQERATARDHSQPGLRGPDRKRHPGHPALRGRRLLPVREQGGGEAGPVLPGGVRLVPGRTNRHGRHRLRLLHDVHRRFGRDHPGPRRPSGHHPREGRLPQAIHGRAPDRLGKHRPPLPAEPARHHLRRDVADEHQGHVRGRAAAGPVHGCIRHGHRHHLFLEATACRGTR